MPAARLTLLISTTVLLAACAEPPPPRSVDEFLQNPIMLEAALVRCAQNRSEMRYEAECVNAREANKLIAAGEEAKRHEEFEKQSERKRQALRRAQEAAATARRRVEEERRRREEAEYLAQFGELPPDVESSGEDVVGDNEPIMVIPESTEVQTGDSNYGEALTAPTDGAANAPGVQIEADSDLESVREELRRRSEE
jgi:hypothetical protein